MESKFYVDFGFYYDSPVDDADMVHPALSIDFAVLVGHTLDMAISAFNFIWRNNINNPNMRYIQLRMEQQGFGIVLSHRTPKGEGDW